MPQKIDFKHQQFINCVEPHLDGNRVVDRKTIMKICKENNISFPNWLTTQKAYSAGYGRYVVPSADGSFNPMNDPSQSFTATPEVSLAETIVHTDPVTLATNDGHCGDPLVPNKMATYVPPKDEWNKVTRIFESGKFFTIYNTGLSGCGKTILFEQVCAELNRKFYRVNITRDTDESDLIGGFRLIDGNTKFEYGPVVEAMRNGGILLLDEVDLATSKIMCLQPVLEGKPIYIKKTNEWVHPEPGFNVVATANTKGKGDTGRFVGTNILNEAFLDRFSICIDHPYPDPQMEAEIIKKIYVENGANWQEDSILIGTLVEWCDMIRKTFENDGEIEEIISTRRLVNIVEHYLLFRSPKAKTQTNILRSIKDCINRFNEADREAFLSTFKALEKNFEPAPVETTPVSGSGVNAPSVDANDPVVTSYNAPF